VFHHFSGKKPKIRQEEPCLSKRWRRQIVMMGDFFPEGSASQRLESQREALRREWIAARKGNILSGLS